MRSCKIPLFIKNTDIGAFFRRVLKPGGFLFYSVWCCFFLLTFYVFEHEIKRILFIGLKKHYICRA
ncbi:hypothetical protein D0T49_05245 [Paludibacter sp. 221]|nr:hypothetical protein [Paludibacter sp. 221]